MTASAQRLAVTLANLRGPIARLSRSLAKADSCFPLADDNLSNHDIDEIDQFLQRYQQVADITLRKLFPGIAELVSGTAPPRFFRDVLDALERAEVIGDAQWWAEVNNQRNRLVHEYAMQPAVRRAELNSAWATARDIVADLQRIEGLMGTLW